MIETQFNELAKRVDMLEAHISGISPDSKLGETEFLRNTRDGDTTDLLNIKGWGPWDYTDLSIDEECPQVCIPKNSRITGFTYYAKAGEAFCNMRFWYRDSLSVEHPTKDTSRILGDMPLELPHVFYPERRIVGINTRINAGDAMSDIQLVYVDSPDGISGNRGVIGFAHPEWGYFKSFQHLAYPGWEIDGIQLGLHYGDSVTAIRVHTRKIVF
jgi:hypothetical protein